MADPEETLDATPGSATADSYLTIADANDLAGKVGMNGWAAKTLEQKEAALRRATLDIDAHRFHHQERWLANQARIFPRAVDLGVIPEAVELATIYQADSLASGTEWDRKVGAGPKAGPNTDAGAGSPLCPNAFRALARWIARVGSYREDVQPARNFLQPDLPPR